MNVKLLLGTALAAAGALHITAACAGVSADEAAKLKTTLMPLGGEKAGNADGSIPAWTGGLVDPNYKMTPDKRRDNLFTDDKPLFSITAQNMGSYADKLAEGTKAMFAKYPDYRIDVYKTERTAAAPDWVYENTFKNATRASLVQAPLTLRPQGAYGGIPFPIPSKGEEVIWNHLLAWRGTSWMWNIHNTLITANGERVLASDATGDQQTPYYFKEGSPETYKDEYWLIRLINSGPAIRAGEGIVGRLNMSAEDNTWVYLTGQRRVRKVPNACCDTPLSSTAGIMSYDEVQVYGGRINRFDWSIVGKKEIYIPYNTNAALKGTDADILGKHYLNPDMVRWELHRVWVVDATLKSGQRHTSPRSRYYMDEDTWWATLGERWDGNDQLWKQLWLLNFAAPDIPAVTNEAFGFYDLVSGAWFASGIMNEAGNQYSIVPRYPDSTFTPDAMAGEGIR